MFCLSYCDVKPIHKNDDKTDKEKYWPRIILFKIYICNLFFETPNNIAFAGYPDDNAPYTYSLNMQTALNKKQ